MTDQPTSLAAALALLQTQLPRIEKSETATVQTKTGNYSYTYAGLAQISDQLLPLMGQLGLSYITRPTFDEAGRFVLAASLLHISGEREDGSYPLPTSGTPQTIGSAITYGRRYCLCALTGIAPEDDDDAAAAQNEVSTGTATRRTPPRRNTPSGPATTTAPRARRNTPPTPPALPGETEPSSWTPQQRARMMAIFSQIGIQDREERLNLSGRIVHRPLASGNDLTEAEASTLIKTLDEATQTEDPIGYLNEHAPEMDGPSVAQPPDTAGQG